MPRPEKTVGGCCGCCLLLGSRCTLILGQRHRSLRSICFADSRDHLALALVPDPVAAGCRGDSAELCVRYWVDRAHVRRRMRGMCARQMGGCGA
jgi:hypothetical protein